MDNSLFNVSRRHMFKQLLYLEVFDKLSVHRTFLKIKLSYDSITLMKCFNLKKSYDNCISQKIEGSALTSVLLSPSLNPSLNSIENCKMSIRYITL